MSETDNEQLKKFPLLYARSNQDNAGHEPYLIMEAKEKGMCIATIHEWQKDEDGREVSEQDAIDYARLFISAPKSLDTLKNTKKFFEIVMDTLKEKGSITSQELHALGFPNIYMQLVNSIIESTVEEFNPVP